MASRRTYGSYNDGCAAAHALDLIGDRWTLIVVRELLFGPKPFVDLERDVPGIGPSVLTQKLGALERAGVVRRETFGPPVRAGLYALTEWGYELEAVNAALSAWAVSSPGLPWNADMSPDALVLAMRAHARPLPTRSQDWVVELVLTDSRTAADPVTYHAKLTSAGTTVLRGRGPDGRAHSKVSATTRGWKHVIMSATAAIGDEPNIAVAGSSVAAQALLDATRLQPTSA